MGKNLQSIIFFLFVLFGMNTLFAQDYTFLHGSYSDTDWEVIRIHDKGLYYSYAQGKSGEIKMVKEGSFKMEGKDIFKVKFPNLNKMYYITLVDGKTLKMTDDTGTYEKFFFLQTSAESKGKDIVVSLTNEERILLLSLLPEEELQKGVNTATKIRRSYDESGNIISNELVFEEEDGFYLDGYIAYEINFNYTQNGGITISYGYSSGGALNVDGSVVKKCKTCMARLEQTSFSTGMFGYSTEKIMEQNTDWGGEWKLVKETTQANEFK